MSDETLPPPPTQPPAAAPPKLEPMTEAEKEAEALRLEVEDTKKKRTYRTRWGAQKVERLSCWPDVRAMIENGVSVPAIAMYVQDERQEYLDATRATLEAALYYWIRKNRALIGERAPVTHVQLISSSPSRIDPLDALNMLFAIQMDRVADHYASEKRANNFTRFNTDAIRLASEIAKSMADIDSRRRRYAPTPPPAAKGPNEVMHQLDAIRRIYEQKFGGVAARVMLNDESRRRVLNAVERVRKGNSEKLMDILNLNEEKANDLKEKEERRVMDTTIDVESTEATS